MLRLMLIAVSLGWPVLPVLSQPPTPERSPPAPPTAPAKANPKRFETGVAAYVNRDIITKAEIWKSIRSTLAGANEEKRRLAFENKLLDTIHDRVIAQGTERIQLIVPDQTIKSMIEEEKERLGGETQFRESLVDRGITDQDYYSQQRDAIQRYIYLRTQAGGYRSVSLGLRAEHVVQPTADEVRRYYRERLEEEFHQPGEAKVRIIALTFTMNSPKGASPEEAQASTLATAERLLGELRTGADFATLAQQHSSLYAEKGGDVGWVKPETELAPEVAKYAFEGQVGVPSPPIQYKRGYFIVLVEERKEARTLPFEEAQVLITKGLREINVKRAQAQVELRLLKDAFIQPVEYKRILIAKQERELQRFQAQ